MGCRQARHEKLLLFVFATFAKIHFWIVANTCSSAYQGPGRILVLECFCTQISSCIDGLASLATAEVALHLSCCTFISSFLPGHSPGASCFWLVPMEPRSAHCTKWSVLRRRRGAYIRTCGAEVEPLLQSKTVPLSSHGLAWHRQTIQTVGAFIVQVLLRGLQR